MPESSFIVIEQSAAGAQRQAENNERLRVGVEQLQKQLEQLKQTPITDAVADAFLAEPPDPRFNTPESLDRMRARLEAKLADEQSPPSHSPFPSIDFFTSFEAANYVGKAAILESDIAEASAGTKGWIRRRSHVGGGAYDIFFQPEGTLESIRLNRTRFLRFFRLMSGTEVEAWDEKPWEPNN